MIYLKKIPDVYFMVCNFLFYLLKNFNKNLLGDYHILLDIFQKYTSHIKIHHDDPEMIKNHDRLSGKIYTTIELPTMSFIEVLEILHKHYFSIVANSTNFGSTTKLQEFILLRNKDTHDTARPLPTIDTKPH